jgi:hypothetical protein
MLSIPFNIFTLVFWIISIVIQIDLFLLYLLNQIILVLILPLIGLWTNWWVHFKGKKTWFETWYEPYFEVPKMLSERQSNLLTRLINLLFILGLAIFFSSYFFNPSLGILIFIIIMGISALLIISIAIRYRKMLALSYGKLIKAWLLFILVLILVAFTYFITIALNIQIYLFISYFFLNILILFFLTGPFVGLWINWLLLTRYKEGKIVYKGKTLEIPFLEYRPFSELPKLFNEKQFRLLAILIYFFFTILLITGLFLLLFFKSLLGFFTLIIALSASSLLTIGITIKYRKMLLLSRNEYIRVWLQFILILITVIFTSFIVSNILGK